MLRKIGRPHRRIKFKHSHTKWEEEQSANQAEISTRTHFHYYFDRSTDIFFSFIIVCTVIMSWEAGRIVNLVYKDKR